MTLSTDWFKPVWEFVDERINEKVTTLSTTPEFSSIEGWVTVMDVIQLNCQGTEEVFFNF